VPVTPIEDESYLLEVDRQEWLGSLAELARIPALTLLAGDIHVEFKDEMAMDVGGVRRRRYILLNFFFW